jgi:hypothetical protein
VTADVRQKAVELAKGLVDSQPHSARQATRFAYAAGLVCWWSVGSDDESARHDADALLSATCGCATVRNVPSAMALLELERLAIGSANAKSSSKQLPAAMFYLSRLGAIPVAPGWAWRAREDAEGCFATVVECEAILRRSTDTVRRDLTDVGELMFPESLENAFQAAEDKIEALRKETTAKRQAIVSEQSPTRHLKGGRQ